ncbi:MAG: ATP-binding protein [Salibacteraceae bacterium]
MKPLSNTSPSSVDSTNKEWEKSVWLHTRDLEEELSWFDRVLQLRSTLNRGKQDVPYRSVYDLHPPDFSASETSYAHFIRQHQLGFDERLAMMMAIAPHLQPKALDIFLSTDGKDSAQGGSRGKSHKGFLPTGETLLFVLAGENLQKRILLNRLFGREHLFHREKVIWLEEAREEEPLLSGKLKASEEFIDLITTGAMKKPRYGSDFPAKYLSTELEWKDLVLHRETRLRLEEIQHWIEHREQLMGEWEMGKRLRPGYLSLFYGPPGTGKSLSAAVLGKLTGKDVFRIDLSGVVSKYIGETEKKLSGIFDRGEHRDWILFFDEADAIFGKRSDTKDAHDRYANHEVAYLLQRIEEYSGLVVLATNLRSNIDDAFQRRFKSVIPFPMPNVLERKQLWEKSFSSKSRLAEDVDLLQIAREFQLAGGSIINVVEYCSVQAIQAGKQEISRDSLIQGIRLEYQKSGLTL